MKTSMKVQILLCWRIAGSAASESSFDLSELKLGPVSTEKLALHDDEDESDNNNNGKSAKKTCDEKVVCWY